MLGLHLRPEVQFNLEVTMAQPVFQAWAKVRFMVHQRRQDRRILGGLALLQLLRIVSSAHLVSTGGNYCKVLYTNLLVTYFVRYISISALLNIFFCYYHFYSWRTGFVCLMPG